ncbi:MAG TPA: hypothetical protein VFQ53_25440 [Kofleriaceae bacterium]|nr:hypothetical protein [Kofleriaceae bacterium]
MRGSLGVRAIARAVGQPGADLVERGGVSPVRVQPHERWHEVDDRPPQLARGRARRGQHARGIAELALAQQRVGVGMRGDERVEARPQVMARGDLVRGAGELLHARRIVERDQSLQRRECERASAGEWPPRGLGRMRELVEPAQRERRLPLDHRLVRAQLGNQERDRRWRRGLERGGRAGECSPEHRGIGEVQRGADLGEPREVRDVERRIGERGGLRGTHVIERAPRIEHVSVGGAEHERGGDVNRGRHARRRERGDEQRERATRIVAMPELELGERGERERVIGRCQRGRRDEPVQRLLGTLELAALQRIDRRDQLGGWRRSGGGRDPCREPAQRLERGSGRASRLCRAGLELPPVDRVRGHPEQLGEPSAAERAAQRADLGVARRVVAHARRSYTALDVYQRSTAAARALLVDGICVPSSSSRSLPPPAPPTTRSPPPTTPGTGSTTPAPPSVAVPACRRRRSTSRRFRPRASPRSSTRPSSPASDCASSMRSGARSTSWSRMTSRSATARAATCFPTAWAGRR